MNAFAGTGRLLVLFARLDRWRIAPWVLLLGFFPVAAYSGYGAVFGNPQDARALELSLGGNPAFTLLFGPAVGLETAMGFTTWRIQILGMFFAALMAVFTVTRHARASEDSGEAELIDSSAVGRYARLTAAVLLAWAASAAVTAVVAGTLVAQGADTESALALGALIGGMGVAFAGVAAVTAQLASFSRTANTLAAGILVLSYILRGLGDTLADAEWLLWTNPMGWAELIRPTSENNWAPFVLLVGFGAVTAVLGAVLTQARDFGSGLVEQRPGPARGRGGIWALTGALNRGPFITWGFTFAALGVIYGLVAGTMSEFFANNEFIRRMLAARVATEADLTNTFVTMLLLIVSMVAGVFGVQIAGRFAVEEDERRAEWVLSGSLSRWSHFAPTAVSALLAPALAMALAGAVLSATASAAGAEVDPGRVALQALATIPALWLASALGLMLVGALPAVRWAVWLVVVYWLVLTMFGPLLNAPEWMLKTSPYYLVPDISKADADWAPVAWILALVVVLVAAGFAGYRRRDLRTV
ncbi:hypothetical protein [Sinomonas halotolerans]|uniref:ABC transporter permease n=1 Tax=Sinomonas halotolerans TaxID=1644133 RepID=A0ABU9X3F1_9MICC